MLLYKDVDLLENLLNGIFLIFRVDQITGAEVLLLAN